MKLTKKNWEKEFDRVFITENLWKSDDGYTANVTVDRVKDFIREIVKL